MAHDGQVFGADFVEGVLRRMPVRHFVRYEVNHVNRGNTALGKRVVVIAADSGELVQEEACVT